MKEAAISITDAARHFVGCINRVHYQGQSFVLLKNGVPFARIVPAGDTVCRGRDLVEALASLELTQNKARSWNKDRKTAHQKLRPPRKKWQ